MAVVCLVLLIFNKSIVQMKSGRNVRKVLRATLKFFTTDLNQYLLGVST